MKKITIQDGGGLENLKIETGDRRPPKVSEIEVNWKATSLNFHDYLVAIGAIKVPDGRIPMSDGAGVITAVGSDVKNWKVGDQVMSLFFPGWQGGVPRFEKIVGVSGETLDGYMCEYSCLDASYVTKIPDGYSYGEAATLPCAGLTAYNGLFATGGLKEGEKVLIQGTGGMSLLAFQMAKANGAKIYATSSVQSKIDRLLDMGSAQVINYKENERWGKTIFNKSDGGIDLTLDVGGGSTMKQSIEAAKIGGRIISIGILGNGRKGEITFPKLFFKFIQMNGIAVGSRKMQEDMVAMINKTGLKPIIDKTFGFNDLAQAFEYQNSQQQFGKIVVEW